jgi:uncharacterized protein YjbI with pentapeptide repeats
MPTCPKCLSYEFDPPLEAWNQDPEGLCLLHSQVTDKDRGGAFTALLAEKKKREDFNFAGVFFPGEVNFINFNFTKEAVFYNAKFTRYVNFSFCNFSGNANFSFAKFSGNANFFLAKFFRDIFFNAAKFSESAIYNDVTFSRNANFRNNTFSSNAYFERVRLESKARVYMVRINPEADPRKHFGYSPLIGDFTGIEIAPNATLLFQECNLSRANFLETDLTQIEFDRVTWASRRRRTAVYDELIWRGKKKFSPESVERLYRQLKSNYEEKKDYKRVGDFHYGEMEMHRLGSPWRRRIPLSWYNLYWALNGYGERPLRALVWFGVFLLAFTGALSWLGLNVSNSGNPASFSEAFRFVIDKATLQRPDWARPVTEPGHWLAAISVFIIPGQLALFFLALRNRLGRRR